MLFVFTSYTANIVALLQSTSDTINTLQDMLDSGLELGAHNTSYERMFFPIMGREGGVRGRIYKKLTKMNQPFMEHSDGIEKMRQVGVVHCSPPKIISYSPKHEQRISFSRACLLFIWRELLPTIRLNQHSKSRRNAAWKKSNISNSLIRGQPFRNVHNIRSCSRSSELCHQIYSNSRISLLIFFCFAACSKFANTAFNRARWISSMWSGQFAPARDRIIKVFGWLTVMPLFWYAVMDGHYRLLCSSPSIYTSDTKANYQSALEEDQQLACNYYVSNQLVGQMLRMKTYTGFYYSWEHFLPREKCLVFFYMLHCISCGSWRCTILLGDLAIFRHERLSRWGLFTLEISYDAMRT